MKPLLAITVGDYNGVGPEVILRSVTRPSIRRLCSPLLIGPASVFEFYARKLRLKVRLVPYDASRKAGVRNFRNAGPGIVPYFEPALRDISQITPGQISQEAGSVAAEAIEHAARLAMRGEVAAIVTAPISKQAMHLAGADFPGQTEMLQHLTSSPRVAMMLVSRLMCVGLVTNHLPLHKVAQTLTIPLIKERITTIHDALVHDWKIRKPLLAVLSLNPHAGEGGDIGREELDIIIPALRDLNASGMRLFGPLPADGFFARYRAGDFDAIVAMYHDQGLVPLKMSAEGRAVNVSVGLPIVRTSPDHGTGFDIAGRGLADPASMIEAISLAVTLATNRKRSPRRPS
jgi:4-hydroxythreonine-4-phosphate dehydrogenase